MKSSLVGPVKHLKSGAVLDGYKGNWCRGSFTGQGKCYQKIERGKIKGMFDYYEGEWQNSKRHGLGMGVFPIFILIGEWKNNDFIKGVQYLPRKDPRKEKKTKEGKIDLSYPMKYEGNFV